jgi:hypothetical protein
MKTKGPRPVAGRSRRRPNAIDEMVRALALAGKSEDEIGAHLGMGRSRLRGRHILDMKAGRALREKRKAAASAAELTNEEMRLYRACMAGFDDPTWTRPDGRCRLHRDMTRAEAEAEFRQKLARLRGGDSSRL